MRSKPFLIIAGILSGIGILIIAIYLGYCPFRTFSSCEKIPWCSKLYIDSLDGPSGGCIFKEY